MLARRLHPDQKDERKRSAAAFFGAALAYYATLGVKVERVRTDNGSCCKPEKLKLRDVRTKTFRPKTSGKVERFIKTALHESVYTRAYYSSGQQDAELPYWVHPYNWHQPHDGIQENYSQADSV